MGRTVPTYRMTLERVMRGWDSFRKPLRRDDREAFDSVMVRGRQHSSASSFNTAADPNETMFMSILLEHEKELRALREKMEEVVEGGGKRSAPRPLDGGGAARVQAPPSKQGGPAPRHGPLSGDSGPASPRGPPAEGGGPAVFSPLPPPPSGTAKRKTVDAQEGGQG